MPIAFACPTCRKPLNVPDAMAGRSGKCPQCKNSIMVPQRGMAMAGAISARSMAAGPMSGRYVQAGSAPRVTGRSPWLKVITLVSLGSAAVTAAMVGSLFLGGRTVDPLDYMPDNCQAIVVLRADELAGTPAFKELKAAFPPMQSEIDKTGEDSGIDFDNGLVVTYGFNVASGIETKGEPDYTYVVQTKNKVTADELKSKMSKLSFTESKAGPFTYYETGAIPGKRKELAFAVLNDKNVLYGTSAQVKKVLERTQKPVLSETLQAALKELDKTKPIGLALSLKDVVAHPEVQKNMAMVPPGYQGLVNDLEYLVLNLGVAADLDLGVILKMKTDESAENLRKLADGMLPGLKLKFGPLLPSEAIEIIDAFKVNAAGNKLSVNLPLKTASVISLAKQGPGLIGRLMMGGGPPPPM